MKRKALAEKPTDVVPIAKNELSQITYTGLDGKVYKLTTQQQKFCEAYLEHYGNGVEAVYAAGYKAKNAMIAAGIAYSNLRLPHLIAYINSKLEEYGYNDDNVAKQHLYVINQMADLRAKNQALDMFYKLKGAYAPDKSVALNINVNSQNPKALELAKDFEEKLKGEL